LSYHWTLFLIIIPVLAFTIYMAIQSRKEYHKSRDKLRGMFIERREVFGLTKEQAENSSMKEIFKLIGELN